MRKEVIAWASYDFANTIFSALFVTFFYPFYVKEFLGGNEFYLGLVFSLSMLFAALLVPFLGAWSDSIQRRIPFVFTFTAICCLATFLVAFSPLLWTLVLGFFANFSYHAALTTYNALLPRVAKPKERGKISGIGIGLGYLGTLASLVVAFFLLQEYGWETMQGAKVIFIATALLFFLFSCILLLIKEQGNSHAFSFSKTLHIVTQNMRGIFYAKTLRNFLFAMFFYTNAITAIIIFLFLYARQEIQLPVKTFLFIYALFAVAAALGSFLGGKYTDKHGAKIVLTYAGVGWIMVIFLLLIHPSLPSFIIAGMLGGMLLGMVWTASRPMLIMLSPVKDIGQYFGFLELVDKFSGMLGPFVFGALAVISYKSALLSLILFFIIGLYFLRCKE